MPSMRVGCGSLRWRTRSRNFATYGTGNRPIFAGGLAPTGKTKSLPVGFFGY